MEVLPELLRTLLSTLLALVAGGGLLRATRFRPGGRLTTLAASWVLGWTVLVPLALGLGLARLPLGPTTLVLMALSVAGLGLGLARRPAAEAAEPRATRALTPEPGWLCLASRLLLVASLGLFVWKVVVWPVWGWDHFAIWGLKARRLLEAGRLDLGFLDRPELLTSRPDYPLGFPLLARLVSLGGLPGAITFKVLHLSFGLSLASLLRAVALELSRRRALAEALTAWAVVSPLFWDSESVGQAEMPLGLWAVAALAFAILSTHHEGRASLWPAGLVLGFLPWIKQEGLPLAAVLVVVLLLGAWREKSRDWFSPALQGWLATTFLGVVVGFLLHQPLPAGVSFFSGALGERVLERLSSAPALLAAMGRFFLLPDFLLLWPVLGLTFAWSFARRRRFAAWLLAGIGAQIALYMSVTFVVYLDPTSHIEASFARILAPLAILGLIALAALAAPRARDSSHCPVYNPSQ